MVYYHSSSSNSSNSLSSSNYRSSSSTSLPLEEDSEDDYPDQEEMDYWLQRCSICFEARLDLCLELCRDQYCLECFQRYISEVVKTSWGLSVTTIRCPVCHDSIPQREWSKFVPRSIVEQYNRFNQPYRSFSRCCPKCQTELVPCKHKDKITQTTLQIPALIRDFLTLQAGNAHHPHYRQLSAVMSTFERQEWTPTSMIEIYQQTIMSLQYLEGLTSSKLRRSHTISQHILSLDMKPDLWRQLQFLHIGFFPVMDCSACHTSVCLQCGNESHFGDTCEASMKRIIREKRYPKDVIATMKWELKHSQRCPNCSIMINRDEGCNKVDCSLCGFCFCWACRSPWSEKCGFYHCAAKGLNPPDLYMNDTKMPEKTELGVPNVSKIEERFTHMA
ncbi:uncharacterized protein BYT42DRAFT_564019 [Radiomyces spectabilis]|uniref:uncharacterized protein n=1 Tax=Radiomyces spectabilis TaxID=64574 RepID=UPI00221F7744|nr:uncharacterized protein BYT42DRAFT_564019 [Radiomyces spectabilis]KAI8384908.1 hypothetical protein BYT42DRAFT_564019 [Radiomyces spectabilis]